MKDGFVYHIDTPSGLSANSTLRTTTPVVELSGWIIAPSGVEELRIHHNRKLIRLYHKLIRRLDVAEQYPDFKGSSESGFSTHLLMKRGRNELLITARDRNGHKFYVTKTLVSRENGRFILHIDEPGDLNSYDIITTSSPLVKFAGWIVAPKGIKNFRIRLNGKVCAEYKELLSRHDVRTDYRHFSNSDKSGFNHQLVLAHGVNKLAITAQTGKAIIRIKKIVKCTFNQRKTPKNKKIYGLNIAGFLKYANGLGAAARGTADAVMHANIPHTLINVKLCDTEEVNWAESSNISNDNKYWFNYIHVNGESMHSVFQQFGSRFFEEKFNIGCWVFEQTQLPSDWANIANSFLNELWTPTDFVLDIFAKNVTIPVTKVPYVVDLHSNKLSEAAAQTKLHSNAFNFLTSFDYGSVFERKNPIAVVNAFQQAFKKNKDVRLVIKCARSFLAHEEHKRLVKSIGNDRRITLIDQFFNEESFYTLLAHCDCYVSMHRSEGFGLPIALAMYLKKPVIATGYSGNMDYMNASNSYLVDYKMIKLKQDYGIFRKGTTWAEPDIEHASELMVNVYRDPVEARRKGLEGSRTIKNLYSKEAVAKTIVARLSYLYDRYR